MAGAAHSANWAHADNHQEWFLSLIVLLVFPSFSILFISMFNNLPFWLGKQPNKCLGPLETTGDGDVSNEGR